MGESDGPEKDSTSVSHVTKVVLFAITHAKAGVGAGRNQRSDRRGGDRPHGWECQIEGILRHLELLRDRVLAKLCSVLPKRRASTGKLCPPSSTTLRALEQSPAASVSEDGLRSPTISCHQMHLPEIVECAFKHRRKRAGHAAHTAPRSFEWEMLQNHGVRRWGSARSQRPTVSLAAQPPPTHVHNSHRRFDRDWGVGCRRGRDASLQPYLPSLQVLTSTTTQANRVISVTARESFMQIQAHKSESDRFNFKLHRQVVPATFRTVCAGSGANASPPRPLSNINGAHAWQCLELPQKVCDLAGKVVKGSCGHTLLSWLW